MPNLNNGEAFSEATLLEALKTAQPGQQLDLAHIPLGKMEDAINGLSLSSQQTGAQSEGFVAGELGTSMPPQFEAAFGGDLDLGAHVKQVSYWWGVRVEVDHEGMLALAGGGAATAALLASLGVTAIAAAVIAGVIAIWSAFDRGNGVIFFVTWTGVHWFTPR